ncbi:MAG: ArsC family (seleno)protein [Acidobacteriota bacterium]
MDANGLEPKEKVSASKKLGRDEAREILAGSSRVIIAKGKKLDDHRTKGAVTDEVLDAFLGSTGNLRAPCLRTGKTTLIGFNEEAWQGALL